VKFKYLNRIILSLLLIGAFLSVYNIISHWLVVGFILGYGTFLLIVSTNIRLNFFVYGLHNNPYEEDDRIALTFDDGPVENTIKILEVLDKYHVKASFFCIGKNIEKNPEIFKLILEKGHFVGNHTYSHTRAIGFLSAGRLVDEILKCDEICRTTGGLTPITFRPPFGIINPQTKRALEITGHRVIGWNVRSYDAIINSENIVLKGILRNLKPGDVILMHDTNEQTVEILEQLLLFLRSNNYRPVRVDTLFKIDAYS
jgi:peptidoglycan-N-acetylglucosamine deacetylase